VSFILTLSPKWGCDISSLTASGGDVGGGDHKILGEVVMQVVMNIKSQERW